MNINANKFFHFPATDRFLVFAAHSDQLLVPTIPEHIRKAFWSWNIHKKSWWLKSIGLANLPYMMPYFPSPSFISLAFHYMLCAPDTVIVCDTCKHYLLIIFVTLRLEPKALKHSEELKVKNGSKISSVRFQDLLDDSGCPMGLSAEGCTSLADEVLPSHPLFFPKACPC